MSEKAKAKKLAAARKKLKEYHQLRGIQPNSIDNYENDNYSIGSNKMETMSESEKSEETDKGFFHMNNSSSNEKLNNAGGIDFNLHEKQETTNNEIPFFNGSENNMHLDAIEVIISEKASLSKQVTNLQTSCKEKDLEIEELNTVLESSKKRIENLERTTIEQNSQISTLRSNLNDLQAKLTLQENENAKYKRQCEEQSDYIEELRNELTLAKSKTSEWEAELKDKTCQLELYKIRINQLSEETNVANDNRVEDLTQMKFANEQRIHDLESMMKQLNTEKEQSSQQYQNYVQHLNKEISTLSEKNLELINERSKLLDREKNMINHIAQLEKQIQEQMLRQEALKSNDEQINNSDLLKENAHLKELIDGLKKQQEELNSNMQTNQQQIAELNSEIAQKQTRIDELEKQHENLQLEKPDSVKLLAAIESDKVAASRAVAQNEELKKQLEEIQLKLIQVTNEKVELVESLQSEQHINKEIRANYDQMSENLKNTTGKLHFKDEEMIRLTHENNELNKKIFQLNQQVDRLMHYEAKEYTQKYVDQDSINTQENTNNENKQNENNHHSSNEDCNHHHHHHHHHDHDHSNENVVDSNHHHDDTEIASEALTTKELIDPVNINNANNNTNPRKISADLPTAEAMQKLQDRFKSLMSDVADLTDEKQRLEHLVLQLQGETETIGEYITLYQTQRRVLKQREIEKDTQLHRLLNEREEMKDKIIELTQLIANLGVQQPFENSQQNVIQEKIHNIITEIKQKDLDGKPVGSCVDHCACCSGKFETI